MKNEFNSNYATPPGDTLLENMIYLGMSYKKLSNKTGLEISALEGIVKNQDVITKEIAKALSKWIASPEYWLRLDKNYRSCFLNSK